MAEVLDVKLMRIPRVISITSQLLGFEVVLTQRDAHLRKWTWPTPCTMPSNPESLEMVILLLIFSLA